jgi:predicted MFS family arabinose efflux permease
VVAAEADVAARKPFRALDHRDFRLLWSVYSIGDLGFWISYISLQWQMASETDSDPQWLGLLFFTNFLPMLVLAPVAGVVADRVDRKRVLVIGRLACAGLAVVLTALAVGDALGPLPLLALAACLGSAFALMAPAGQAVLANAVPASDLASAVSLQSAGANVTRIAGPALAAPLLGWFGAGATFSLYAVSNVAMAAGLRRVRIAAHPPRTTLGGSVLGEFRDGLRHARDRRPALAALGTMACFSIFGAAFSALYPVFATEVFDRDETAFTIFVMANGAGAILGALTTGFRRGAPTLRDAARNFALFAVTLLVFARSTSWALSLAVLVVNGLFYFATTTTLNTLLHHLADDDKRGRMMSLFTLTWAGLIPFGGLWMGSLAEATGPATPVTIGAVACLAVSCGVLVRSFRPGGAIRHA